MGKKGVFLPLPPSHLADIDCQILSYLELKLCQRLTTKYFSKNFLRCLLFNTEIYSVQVNLLGQQGFLGVRYYDYRKVFFAKHLVIVQSHHAILYSLLKLRIHFVDNGYIKALRFHNQGSADKCLCKKYQEHPVQVPRGFPRCIILLKLPPWYKIIHPRPINKIFFYLAHKYTLSPVNFEKISSPH